MQADPRECRTVLLVVNRGGYFSRKGDKADTENDSALKVRKHRDTNDGANLHDTFQSLSSKSSVKTSRSYVPPSDLKDRMAAITAEICGKELNWAEASIEQPILKFKVLSRFIQDFKHNIPSSQMSSMKTVGDALDYFRTEVHDSTAVQDLAKLPQLPKNLHIQQNPHRFDPETDTFFGGVTAFPKRDTIVTGLKTKKLYKGVKAKKQWYDYIE
ncbi:uncharacterized protein LOC135501981 isoform X2 [Lineus longissimus]|uniref:uncharacterized protein LOC135501981 isoform X2 n=1 Tax=Lineus longissimus TaxID=88925 RepID=UPI002B4CC5C0